MRRELDKLRLVGDGIGGGGAVAVAGGEGGTGRGGGPEAKGDGGSVPAVYFVDEARGEIYMEWIEGRTVREVLDKALVGHYGGSGRDGDGDGDRDRGGSGSGEEKGDIKKPEDRQAHAQAQLVVGAENRGRDEERDGDTKETEGTQAQEAQLEAKVEAEAEAEVQAGPDTLRGLMSRIGATVARMHRADVVHGDLTTSNIMLRPLPPTPSSTPTTAAANPTSSLASTDQLLAGQVVLIDFGLGAVSTSDEDMAVDLYVLERAFVSTHPQAEDLFRELLAGYEKTLGKKGVQVLRRLAEVRMRGRKRSMLG